MKKFISYMLLMMIVVSSCSFASDVTDLPFELKQEGDYFTIILDENLSTGYEWHYDINKPDHVKFIESDHEAAKTDMVGASGKRLFEFQVLNNGVSNIMLSYQRSWEEVAAESIDVLVYKNGDKVYIEENQEVSICEVKPQERSVTMIEGKAMLPLRAVLEELEYELIWNGETQSIDIQKGPQWTSLKIDKNAYFKNKMAAVELSAAPTLHKGQTFVPVEFFAETMGLSVTVQDGKVMVKEGMVAIASGSIKELAMTDGKITSMTLTRDTDSDDMADLTIIHLSDVDTFMNTSLKVGKEVRVITSPIMTMSLPAQTMGYVIY